MASIERSLWRPLCLHSATTATLEPPWQWFCLHSAFFARPVVPLQQLWSFKEGTRLVLQQLHRNRTFWVPATTERPNHFYGRTKVARRSQPCVKGPLTVCSFADQKKAIKAPRHWPLWGESAGDHWTLLTTGQWRGKCFHLMTTSCKLTDKIGVIKITVHVIFRQLLFQLLEYWH